MARYRYAAYLAGAMAALSLTACADQPWTLARSPDAITLRWYSDTTREAQARSIAGAYCAGIGRPVRQGVIQRDGSAVIARYRCV